MSLRINTNVAALNAYNNLSMTQSKLDNAFSQLSSGLRINKAADDASGLAISQGLTSQINGLTQSVSNAQDATNVAQIADGALGTVQTVLQRMRTLVVQAGNSGTQDTTSLKAIQSEVTALNSQLDSIGGQTKFGSKALLDGTYNANFQVGANGGDVVSLDLSSAAVKSTSLGGGGNFLSGLKIVTDAFADADPTATPPTAAVTYTNGTAGTSDTETDLKTIDAAISTISNARSSIGAAQNQLSYTTTNLQTAITNVTASRSNLTDADLATQVTAMTQQQVLAQAATSVLAQANSAPQAVLKLLQ